MILQNQNLDNVFLRRISQSEIRNSAAAESEGGQKFLPPNPLLFCPPERSVLRAKRAISFVQKMFEQSCIIPPQSNFPIFARPIRPREARKGTETLALRAPPAATIPGRDD